VLLGQPGDIADVVGSSCAVRRAIHDERFKASGTRLGPAAA
jgi:hypothetical protein